MSTEHAIPPVANRAKPWPPALLDMAALAHELQASERHVRRLLAGGRLPPADLNISGTGGLKGRRWRRHRLLAWLDSHGPVLRGVAENQQ